MRRKKQEILDKTELEEIFREAVVCRLAIADADAPYIVPLNFGYRDNTLYFHSASEGRKLDLLRRHPDVGFELESGVEIVRGETACNWGVSFRSIIGYGRASIVEGSVDKRHALDIIMAHYSDEQFEFPDENLKRTVVVRVDITSMTGKRSAV